jgi:hypothetical protein
VIAFLIMYAQLNTLSIAAGIVIGALILEAQKHDP